MSKRKGFLPGFVFVTTLAVLVVFLIFMFYIFHADIILGIKTTTYAKTDLDDKGTGLVVLLGSDFGGMKAIESLGSADDIPPEIIGFIDDIHGSTYHLTIERGNELLEHGSGDPKRFQVVAMDIPLPGARPDNVKGEVRLKQW